MVVNYNYPKLKIDTDTSLERQGVKFNSRYTGRRFSGRELHIADDNLNVLEVLATSLAPECFATELSGTHVLVRSDNTSAQL